MTRIVLLVGPLAIKLPRFGYGWAMGLRGMLCNMQERAIWTLGWQQLCPVLFALPGGFVLVMRRARELTNEEWSTCTLAWMAEFRYHRRCELDERRIEGIVPVEYKRDSFGFLEGRIVAVDYGS